MYRRIARLGPPLCVAMVLAAACAAPGTRPGTQAPPRPLPPTVVPTSSTAPPETTATCSAAGVLIRVGGTDAAMGLRVVTIELVNCGTQPYTVNGYPAIRVLGDHREPLDVATDQGTTSIPGAAALNAGPRPVTLGPGQTAVATVAWRNLVTDATVVATTGTYLEVARAAGEPPQILAPDGPIDVGNTGRIGVTAWVAR